MVGEPYHGGDFMTLTQRAKEQQVPMTEAVVGSVLSSQFRVGTYIVLGLKEAQLQQGT